MIAIACSFAVRKHLPKDAITRRVFGRPICNGNKVLRVSRMGICLKHCRLQLLLIGGVNSADIATNVDVATVANTVTTTIASIDTATAVETANINAL